MGRFLPCHRSKGAWQVLFAQNRQPVIANSKLPVDPSYLDDLAWLKQLSDAGVSLNLAANSVQERETYKNGSVVFFLVPAWGVKVYLDSYDKYGSGRWDIVPVPGGACEYGGNSLGIPARAANKLEAWAYLDWAYNSVEGNLVMAKMTKSIPILKASYDQRLVNNSSSMVGTNLASFWTRQMQSGQIRTRSAPDMTFSEAVLENLVYMTEADESADELLARAVQGLRQQWPELSR